MLRDRLGHAELSWQRTSTLSKISLSIRSFFSSPDGTEIQRLEMKVTMGTKVRVGPGMALQVHQAWPGEQLAIPQGPVWTAKCRYQTGLESLDVGGEGFLSSESLHDLFMPTRPDGSGNQVPGAPGCRLQTYGGHNGCYWAFCALDVWRRLPALAAATLDGACCCCEPEERAQLTHSMGRLQCKKSYLGALLRTAGSDHMAAMGNGYLIQLHSLRPALSAESGPQCST